MKELKIILVVLLIILPVFGVYRYTESQAPEWTAQARIQTEIQQATAPTVARQEMERTELWTVFYRALMTALIVGLFVAIGVLGWKQYDERRESWARMVDGSYALQTFKNAQGQLWTVDPNKSQFGAIGFDKSSGQLVTDAAIVGPDRQLSYAQAIQRTRTAQATAISEIRNSAQAKYASGYYDRPQRPEEYRVVEDEPDQLTVAPWQPLTLADAFAKSAPDRWLLGQNATGPCEFNVLDVVHTGLLGATKTGKTSSTALLMAMNAKRQGMHVIALDGAGGIDWQPYSHVFEVYPTDYSLIGDQLGELIHLHDVRMKSLKLAGAANLDELDYQVPSTFVILEEFGRTMQAFKTASKRQYELTESALSNLMRVSRKTGIYFLLIDQSMSNWSPIIKANVKDYISYHLGGNQGNAFNAYDLHKLRPNGQFWNNGGVFDAWFTKPEAERMLQKLQPSRTKLLTDVQYSVTHADTRHGGEVSTESAPLPNVSVRVSDEAYQSKNVSGSVSSSVSSDTSPDTNVSPRLTGKPVSKKDIDLVRNTYALTNSARETARILWGKRNDSRTAWVKEIVSGKRIAGKLEVQP